MSQSERGEFTLTKRSLFENSRISLSTLTSVVCWCLFVLYFVPISDSLRVDILTNHIHDGQILTYRTRGSALHACPKWLNCTSGFFDEGKDCHEAAVRGQCNCIAHCCLAFDCRNWAHLVQCRRKCGASPNKFGLRRTDSMDCDKYHCDRTFFEPDWDLRGATDAQRQCVAHCCYAFDCRRALGYCRHACGVDAWVTARPLGRRR